MVYRLQPMKSTFFPRSSLKFERRKRVVCIDCGLCLSSLSAAAAAPSSSSSRSRHRRRVLIHPTDKLPEQILVLRHIRGEHRLTETTTTRSFRFICDYLIIEYPVHNWGRPLSPPPHSYISPAAAAAAPQLVKLFQRRLSQPTCDDGVEAAQPRVYLST